ncbi:MAG: hypothetical protein JSU63_04655 [Phycisphaerales bacterium]|nr:MAG: hypothetical protein JSU63_04655 [Phycisphaerales bacterium]
MSKRARLKQFQETAPGVSTTLSTWLVKSGYVALQNALDERRGGVYRTACNHFSSHAPASILLLVTGFDAWLNEALWILDPYASELRSLAEKPPDKRYCSIPKLVNGTQLPKRLELQTVFDVRHEIAHYLPRVVEGEGKVPEWLVDLHQRKLLLTSPHPSADFGFGNRLCSYSLAYWTWTIIDSAIADFLEALGESAQLLRRGAGIFSMYTRVCAPTRLALYDSDHNLKLTEEERQKKREK